MLQTLRTYLTYRCKMHGMLDLEFGLGWSLLQQFLDDSALGLRRYMQTRNHNIFYPLHPKHKLPHLYLIQLVVDGNCELHIYSLDLWLVETLFFLLQT